MERDLPFIGRKYENSELDLLPGSAQKSGVLFVAKEVMSLHWTSRAWEPDTIRARGFECPHSGDRALTWVPYQGLNDPQKGFMPCLTAKECKIIALRVVFPRGFGQ